MYFEFGNPNTITWAQYPVISVTIGTMRYTGILLEALEEKLRILIYDAGRGRFTVYECPNITGAFTTGVVRLPQFDGVDQLSPRQQLFLYCLIHAIPLPITFWTKENCPDDVLISLCSKKRTNTNCSGNAICDRVLRDRFVEDPLYYVQNKAMFEHVLIDLLQQCKQQLDYDTCEKFLCAFFLRFSWSRQCALLNILEEKSPGTLQRYVEMEDKPKNMRGEALMLLGEEKWIELARRDVNSPLIAYILWNIEEPKRKRLAGIIFNDPAAKASFFHGALRYVATKDVISLLVEASTPTSQERLDAAVIELESRWSMKMLGAAKCAQIRSFDVSRLGTDEAREAHQKLLSNLSH